MHITFLGTGADERVPDPWCRCSYCQLARLERGPNVRLCSAVLINDDLLIDAGPDVPSAAARLGCDLTLIQGLLVTHPHDDHLHPRTLHGRHRDWGGTPLPLLTVYGSRTSLSLFRNWDGLRLRPQRIAPFEHFSIETGGSFPPDPRKPLHPGVPPIAEEPLLLASRRYEVWTLAACHGIPEDEAMLFVVQQVAGPEVVCRSEYPAMLYATDTGSFPAQTWTALDELSKSGVRFAVTALDATMGVGREGHGSTAHMTLDQVIDHHHDLKRRSLLAPGCHQLAHHFSHYFTPPHEQLEAILVPHGIQPAHDGLVLDL